MANSINGQITNAALTYTLSSFIDFKDSDEYTFRKYSILENIDGIENLDHNVIENYLSELERLAISCPLTYEQYAKYKYSPDLLAYDVYGSTQLDFVVLYINGMNDPKEFNKKTIKLLYKSDLFAFLDEVYTAEAPYIIQNRALNGIKD